MKRTTEDIVKSMQAMRSNTIAARVAPFAEGLATFATIGVLWDPPPGAIVSRSRTAPGGFCFVVLRHSVPEADLEDLDAASGKFAEHDRFYVDVIETAMPILRLWGVSPAETKHAFEIADYPF